MRDPEFILLRNRFLIGLGICIVLFTPLYMFLHNKLLGEDSKVLERIEQQDSFLIIITSRDCNNCREIEKEIKQQGLDYQKITREKDSNYKRIMYQLDLNENDIEPPTIIYIDNGKVITTLTDIKEKEEITTFVESFNLK